MSKNNQANHSSHLENHDLDNFSKTGYSNSRLSVHIDDTPSPKIIKTNHICGWFPFWF